jgi:hypothetical protein
MSQAITAAINGDVLEVHPGVYTFANDTIQSDMISLTIRFGRFFPRVSQNVFVYCFVSFWFLFSFFCRGAGPPEAIVFSAVQPLQLLVENVLLQNVTFMGGVEVRKNATLDNVVVNSTAHDDRKCEPFFFDHVRHAEPQSLTHRMWRRSRDPCHRDNVNHPKHSHGVLGHRRYSKSRR